MGGIVLTVIYDSSNWILLGLLALYALVWPHVAYFLASRAKDTRKAELRNYHIEGFFSGFWMVVLSFSLWPCCAIVVAGFANNIVTGSFKMLGKTLLFVGIGIALGWATLGLEISTESTPLTSYLSAIFILGYNTLIAMQTFRNAKSLVKHRKELKVANVEIGERYTMAEREIDERKKVEHELLRANDALKRFAYSVSHDLRAPLRSMASLMHFIEQDISEESRKATAENFQVLHGRVKRLDGLIEGIHEYTMAGEGGDNELLEPKKVINEVLDSMELPDHVALTVDDDFSPLRFNRAQLVLILENLISNAVKFNNNEKIIIHIGYKNRKNMHEFHIRDNGEGIPEKFHDRIFEMFQVLHPRDEVEGSGIGLSIVKKIVNQHGGEVWVQSSANGGSVIYFTLPKKSQ